MEQRNTSAALGSPEEVLGLSLNLQKTKATEIASFLETTSLELPVRGQYSLALNGGTLHIYESKHGIQRFNFSEDGEQGETAFINGEIEIDLENSGLINKIVLHTEAGQASQELIALEELDAPTGLLDEYATLANRRRLSPDELQRKRELIKEIRTEFIKTKTVERVHRITPSIFESSSESRCGGGYSRGSG